MKKHRTGGWAGLMVMFGFMAGIWAVGTIGVLTEEWDSALAIVGAVTEAILIWLTLICRKKAPLRTDEEIARMREQADQQWRAAKETWARDREAERERKRLDTTPVAAVLISVQSEYGKNVMGTAARGMIGAVLGGTFGAAVGIATGRAKGNAKTATFSVKYESGRKGLETVNVNTPRFKELATLLVD